MKYYTLKDVCKMVNLSKRQLYRLCKEGIIKYEKRQGNGCIIETFIPETEIEVLQNRRCAGRPFGTTKNKDN